MPPLAAAMITIGGWKLGYLIFGLLLLLLALVALTTIRDDHPSIQNELTASKRLAVNSESNSKFENNISLRYALRDRRFWLIFFAISFSTFTYQGVLTQLHQHFSENGFSNPLATTGMSTIAGLGILSKLCFGRASERWTARRCFMLAVAFQAIGLSIMATTSLVIPMWIGIIVFGMGFGGLGALIILLVQEAFGIESFGSIFGVIQIGMHASIAGAPAIAGWAHDRYDSFSIAFLIIVVIFVFSIISLFITGPDKSQNTEIK